MDAACIESQGAEKSPCIPLYERGKEQSRPHRIRSIEKDGLFRPDEQVVNRIAEIALLSGQALYEAEQGGWNRVIEIMRGIRFLAVEGCQQAGLTDHSLSEGVVEMVVGFFETRPEVKAFVAELLDEVPAAKIQESVRERFGAENVPSKSLLCRMRMRSANPRRILSHKQAKMPAPQEKREREAGKTKPVLWDERKDLTDFCSSLAARGVKPREIRTRAEKKFGLKVTAVQLYILREGLRRGRWGKKKPVGKQAERPVPQTESMGGRNDACPKGQKSPQPNPLPCRERGQSNEATARGRGQEEGRGNGNGLKREFITDKLRAIPGLPQEIAARLNADFIGCCQLPGIIRISNNSCLSRQVGDHIYDLDLKTCRGCPMLLEEEVRMMIRAALKARVQRNVLKKQAGKPAPHAESMAGRNACPTEEVRAVG